MKRLVERWWLVGAVLLVAVLVLARAIYSTEAGNRRQQQRAVQHQAANILGEAVHDVLGRELALTRVIRAVGAPRASSWPALASIVTSQPAATSAGFIVPVPDRDRLAFERRTGLRLVVSPSPGVVEPDTTHSLHLVSVDGLSKTSKPLLGLDVGTNALRRSLLLQAAATNRQLATPPLEFLGPVAHRHGVVVYAPVFGAGHHLEGWVSASYQTEQLSNALHAALPKVGVTVRDGAKTLLDGDRGASGSPVTITVAGRQWNVWAVAGGTPISPVPWLVLGFGLALVAAVTLILRQAAGRERYAARKLAEHDAEEAALSRIATLVARSNEPEAVFTAVAREVGVLLSARTAAISRFDGGGGQGVVVGGWTPDGETLTGSVFALDGVTASSLVYRTGKAARTEATYASQIDPIAPLMRQLGGSGGIAAPIFVGGELWGALGAAYTETTIPEGVEHRLERFGRLVGLAIANADAWDKLDRLASTDTLTGIANRRTLDDRLRTELARVRRHDRALSLAVFDLDHFKRINDTHGHSTGDRVLAEFARTLVEHARQSDLVARVGGEEFVWLMPETDQDGAYIAAERLRADIEQTPPGGLGPVTVSGGVATAGPFSAPLDLIHKADLALYEAKREGRNRIVRAEADEVSGPRPAGEEPVAAPPAS